jgi:hypothetical protein
MGRPSRPLTRTLGNYRQHITFASFLGVGYAWGAYTLAGIHWMYGSVAALLATLGGLLPDLDSASGVELKGFTGILGVLTALAVWQKMGQVEPPPAFEFHLWAVVCSFVIVRHGLRRVMTRLAVHRGISHSLPTCAVWGALSYLFYPTDNHALRVVMGIAVMIGFLSHLLLDEICSVDLRGARVNKAFGTAIKLWAPSICPAGDSVPASGPVRPAIARPAGPAVNRARPGCVTEKARPTFSVEIRAAG